MKNGIGLFVALGLIVLTGATMFQESVRTPFRKGLSTDTLQSYTSSLHPVVNDSLDIVGRIMKYNNIATEGYGVPAVVDYYKTGGADASITETNLSNALAAGAYRVSVYLECDAVDSGNDSVYAKIGWNTSGGMKYDSTAWVALSAAGVYGHKVIPVYHTAGDTMTFQTVMDADQDADTYIVLIVTERLN